MKRSLAIVLPAVLGLACVVPDARFRERAPNGSGHSSDGTTESGAGTGDRPSQGAGGGSGAGDGSGRSDITTATGDSSDSDQGGSSESQLGGDDTEENSELTEDSDSETTSSQSTTDAELTDSEDGESTSTTGSDESGTGAEQVVLPIVLENRAIDALPLGYAVTLTFDHAAMIENGAAADASDLRIRHLDGGSAQSLAWQLDDDSAFGAVETRIWFALAAQLPGLRVDDRRYALVYAADETLPRVEADVFTVHDDFSGETLSADWTIDVQGDHIIEHAGSRLHLALNGEEERYSYLALKHARALTAEGLMIESRATLSRVDLTAECGIFQPLGLASDPPLVIRAGAAIFEDGLSFVYGEGQRRSFSTAIPGVGTRSMRYGLRWSGSLAELFLDGRLVWTGVAGSEWPRPDTGPLVTMIHFDVGSDACGDAFNVAMDLDWVRVRPVILPEPTVRLR